MTRSIISLVLALGAAACGSVPLPPPKPVGPTFEQKMAWVLRFEDQRILRDEVPPAPAPAPPPPPARARGKSPVVTPPPPPPPDLIRLLTDEEARVRRRAALAVGRVGLVEGVTPLLSLLSDADPEVRQMAAFALGLLGDARASAPLVQALADPSWIVRGSAAEALGLIGDRSAADAIGNVVAQLVQSGVLAQPPGDDADVGRDTPAGVFRLGVYALVRLNAFDQLAAAVLDAAGQPRVRWWPVAYALQRVADKRALNALLSLATDEHLYTRLFAVKGLAELRDRVAVPVLAPLVASTDRAVAVEAVRALGRIGDAAGAAPLMTVVRDRKADSRLRAEAITAVGSMRADGAYEILLDLVSDSRPEIRSAALGAVAAADPENFTTVLSGLDPDPDWSVRATLATVMGTLEPERGLPRLAAMLRDTDQRVIPSVVASLVKLRDPNAATILSDRLKADDPAVRASAATLMGELKPSAGAAALAAAYTFGLRDTTYIARAAALTGLAKYGASEAKPMLTMALTDKDWAVRVRASTLLKQLDSTSDVTQQIRPAPTRLDPEAYGAPPLVAPSVSTHVYVDTDRGTIQIELAMLDATLTVDNFITLARNGFFDGLRVHRVVPGFVVQTGDPRGDGEGGPGYTIRDEPNELPYLRGSVGMALDWADTGGSQFFVTQTPQPQLDAKYTLFGRVVQGMEVIDAIQQGDVIRRVRVWDGPPTQ
jgi:HEAT repeat protein